MIKGEFIGFSFNGKHSSEFNIVRVSEGSRFKEDLIPTFQDKTVAVPGGDGSYLFGTNYTQRTRTISFAYDNLTEEKLVALRRWLAAGEIGELILDEWPYKAWDVKVSTPPSLSFVPFDDKETGGSATLIHNHFLGGGQASAVSSKQQITRFYKGEGTISFIAYQPFAHNPKGKKWLDDYITDYKDELDDDVFKASGLTGGGGYDTFVPNEDDEFGGSFKVYNAGDLPCDFNLIFSPQITMSNAVTITGTDAKGNVFGTLSFTVPAEYNNKKFRVNTKLHLIEDLNTTTGKITGIVCNHWITGGDFFKLPLGKSTITINKLKKIEIEYNYRYL